MSEFIAGRRLAARFYQDVVRDIVAPVPHSAALLGWGSDVLGYDTERSSDHGWGPRLALFVEDSEVESMKERIEEDLPNDFLGWPTRFGWDEVPVRHHVDVTTIGRWLETHLGIDPRGGLEPADWLALPQQLLLEATSGEVFHDGLGELNRVRTQLSWYPDDVWLYLLACQWHRIAQEEGFVGRTAEVGDELGSRMIATRLMRDLVRLCFLIERRYAPYVKWLGSAFATLSCAPAFSSFFDALLNVPLVAQREEACAAHLKRRDVSITPSKLLIQSIQLVDLSVPIGSWRPTVSLSAAATRSRISG